MQSYSSDALCQRRYVSENTYNRLSIMLIASCMLIYCQQRQ